MGNRNKQDVLDRLHAVVNMSLSSTTLEAIAKVLSSQASVEIAPDPFLRTHQLSLFARNISALSALDLICESNGWTWNCDPTGTVHITRRQSHSPKRLNEVYSAVLSCLPLDWQRFISEVPPADSSPGPRIDSATRSDRFYERTATLAASRRITELNRSCVESLLASFGDYPKNTNRVATKDLSPSQRQDLIACLVLSALDRLSRSPAAAIFFGKPAPYQLNPGSAEIRLMKGGIWIGTIEDRDGLHRERGFGASLVPIRM
jgi:hypothetical protein